MASFSHCLCLKQLKLQRSTEFIPSFDRATHRKLRQSHHVQLLYNDKCLRCFTLVAAWIWTRLLIELLIIKLFLNYIQKKILIKFKKCALKKDLEKMSFNEKFTRLLIIVHILYLIEFLHETQFKHFTLEISKKFFGKLISVFNFFKC